MILCQRGMFNVIYNRNTYAYVFSLQRCAVQYSTSSRKDIPDTRSTNQHSKLPVLISSENVSQYEGKEINKNYDNNITINTLTKNVHQELGFFSRKFFVVLTISNVFLAILISLLMAGVLNIKQTTSKISKQQTFDNKIIQNIDVQNYKSGSVTVKVEQGSSTSPVEPSSRRYVEQKPPMVSTLQSGTQTRDREKTGNIEKLTNNQPWNVRQINRTFTDILETMKLVKTIEKLSIALYRVTVVKNTIWIGNGGRNSDTVAVYDLKLNKIKEYKFQGVYVIQQVSMFDVLLLTDYGLHVIGTDGTYKYKVADGVFSDVSIYLNKVAVIDCEKNRIILLIKHWGRWEIKNHVYFSEYDKRVKTLQFIDSMNVIIGVHWSDKLLHFNIETGQVLHRYGTGTNSTEIGDFDAPFVNGIDKKGNLIVSDFLNDRFQILDLRGKWKEVRCSYYSKQCICITGVFSEQENHHVSNVSITISTFFVSNNISFTVILILIIHSKEISNFKITQF